MVSDEIQGSSRRFGRVHVLRVTFFGASIDCLSRHVAKPPLLWGNGTLQVEASPFFGDTVDGKNSAPLRMLQMLVLYQYQDLLGHPKWHRIFSINRMT